MVGTIASAVGGEKARERRTGLYLLGTVTGSTVLAGGSATIAALVPSPPVVASSVVFMLMLLLLIASHFQLVPVPGPKRQVNPHVWHLVSPEAASLAWGFQLGLGLTSRVSTWGLYVLILAPWLLEQPVLAFAGIVAFGFGRGLQPAVASRLQRPDDLLGRLNLAGAHHIVALALTMSLLVTVVSHSGATLWRM